MKALYFGIAVTVLLELGQLALVAWGDRRLIVERCDLSEVQP